MKSAVRILRVALNKAGYVLVALLVVHIIAGVLFSLIEDRTIAEGQWWATVTGFTVGYGDLYPVTPLMRIIAMVYIPLMAFLWLVVGAHLVAAIIEDKHLFSNEEQERLEAAMVALLVAQGILPPDTRKMPPTTWWAQQRNFDPSPD